MPPITQYEPVRLPHNYSKGHYKGRAALDNKPALHAKLFVFDRIAVIASASASEYSRNHLFEAGVVTDLSAVVSAAKAYPELLKKRSIEIDRHFSRRMLSIEVVRNGKPLFFPSDHNATHPVEALSHMVSWLQGTGFH